MGTGTRWSFVLGMAVAMATAAEVSAQQDPFGLGGGLNTGMAAGGYSYTAPSYQLGLAPSSFALGRWYGLGYGNRPSAGYAHIENSPAYLYSAPTPQLDFIPAQYQTGYRYGLGSTGLYGRSSLGRLYSPSLYPYYGGGYYSGDYLSPGIASFGYTPQAMLYGNYFRPYVTTSQYVYTPTYTGSQSLIGGAPYGAVLGSYGYSAIGGYGF